MTLLSARFRLKNNSYCIMQSWVMGECSCLVCMCMWVWAQVWVSVQSNTIFTIICFEELLDEDMKTNVHCSSSSYFYKTTKYKKPWCWYEDCVYAKFSTAPCERIHSTAPWRKYYKYAYSNHMLHFYRLFTCGKG